MLTVAIVHQKGGSGKSTLSIHAAAAAHLAGLRTCIIDADVQATALSWWAERREGSRLEGLTVMGPGRGATGKLEDQVIAKGERTIAAARLRELTDGYDVAIIDGPAREGGITRSAAVFADIALVPIMPAAPDFWCVTNTTDSIDQADEIRAGIGLAPVKRCFVINAAKVGTVLARDARAELEAARLGVCLGTVHHRVVFAVAVSRAESVFTMPAPVEAQAEITRLWKALKGIHGSAHKRPQRTKPGQAAAPARRRDGRRGVTVRG